MPKKKQPKKQQVAPVQEKIIYRDRVVEKPLPLKSTVEPLKMEDRDYLKTVFSNPIFIQAFQNARLQKPTAFISVKGVPADVMATLASNRLHEIRGWEAFEKVLLSMDEEPKVSVAKPITENYPDAGTIDSYFAPQTPKPKTT